MERMSPILHSEREGERPLKSRRSHTKSRRGCVSCKQRKVKCDEAHPTCRRCELREQECVYPAGIPPRARPQRLNLTITQPLSGLNFGNPQSRALLPYDATRPENSSNTIGSSNPTVDEVYRFTTLFKRLPGSFSPLPPSPPSAAGVNLKDLALMHHYCVHTSTLSMSSSRQNCAATLDAWQMGIPSIAFHSRTVMHAMLALAALCIHIDELNKDDPNQLVLGEYLHLAESHHDRCLSAMRREVSSISASNMGVVLATSTLLSSFAFAYARARPSTEVDISWISMCRGVNACMDVARKDPVAFMASTSPLAAILTRETSGGQGISDYSNSEPRSGLPYKHPVYSTLRTTRNQAFARLRDFLDGETNEESANCCISAVDALENITNILFDERQIDEAPTQTILSWSCDISSDFLELLKSSDPMAMTVLAYLYVFIILLDDAWTVADKAKVEISKISSMLGPSWEKWIEWPQSMVLVSEQLKRYQT